MSSTPQTTACVLGLRAGRENSKPAELSGQARRLRQRVPPGDGFDALPGCGPIHLNLPAGSVADEAPLPIAARWQCHVLEVIGRQLALGVSQDAVRYIVSIFERKRSAF
jgi:hypothetical protein